MDLSVLDISYKWSYIMCELLCIISFRVLFPRFIHVVACIRNLFLFTAEYGRFPRWLSGKESACQCRRHRRHGFDPWDGKISWRRKWQSTPGFLLGKSHGQRSLAGYSPWGCGETRLCTWAHTHTHTHTCIYCFLFFHSSLDERLGCFHLLTIVISAAIRPSFLFFST